MTMALLTPICSERIARREDLIEEQKELERLKKRKKN